jgi:hypothetical protein
VGKLVVLGIAFKKKAEELVREFKLENESICIKRALPINAYTFPRNFQGKTNEIKLTHTLGLFTKVAVFLSPFFILYTRFSFVYLSMVIIFLFMISFYYYRINKTLIEQYDSEWYVVLDFFGWNLPHELAHIKLHEEIMKNEKISQCLNYKLDLEVEEFLKKNVGDGIFRHLHILAIKGGLFICRVLSKFSVRLI